MRIRFEVFGRAQQKGSAMAFVVKSKATGKPRAVVTTTNKKSKDWEADVRFSAAPHRPPETWSGPVAIAVLFVMTRPKALKGKWAPYLKAPDLDKLLRSLCDGLTGVIFNDDCQIVYGTQHKRYARPGENPRAIVTVWQPTSEELLEWEHSVEPLGPVATDGREMPLTPGGLF